MKARDEIYCTRCTNLCIAPNSKMQLKIVNFSKLNNNIEIISVTTLDSILFDEPTKKNINKIKPGKIILRRGSGNNEIKIDFKCDLKNFDKFSQWEYQKKFFHFGRISLFLSELFYGSNFKDKIKNFLNALPAFRLS